MPIFSQCLRACVGLALCLGPLAGEASAADMSAMPGMTHALPPDAEFAQAMAAMDKAMTGTPMTGDTDRDFVTMMIGHHEGAIAMARTELAYGKDPMLRRLADAIVAAQTQEIGVMKDWLARHPLPPSQHQPKSQTQENSP